MDSDGNLYGTTGAGGAYGNGTVFEIAVGSGVITTLASFSFNGDVSADSPLLLDSDGNLFGTTGAAGDANGDGTLFEIVKGSGASQRWLPSTESTALRRSAN